MERNAIMAADLERLGRRFWLIAENQHRGATVIPDSAKPTLNRIVQLYVQGCIVRGSVDLEHIQASSTADDYVVPAARESALQLLQPDGLWQTEFQRLIDFIFPG